MKNFYRLEPEFQLTRDQAAELLEIQNQIRYVKFMNQNLWDGNNVTLDYREVHPHLPQWIWDRFGSDITCIFLKNQGNVVIHSDVNRAGVVTFPLVFDEETMNSYTYFYSEKYDSSNNEHINNSETFITDKLYHHGQGYLTNVSVKHSVPEKYNNPRTFFQFWIRGKTWNETVEIMNERGVIKKGSV